MVKKYRKKPVEIEAMRFRDEQKTITEILKWGNDFIHLDLKYGASLKIETLEGEMVAKPGDYIVKGIKGEFYPCKPEVFEKTYEEVI
jgi:hypothetical protein